MCRKAQKSIKSITWYKTFIVYKNPASNLKTHYFLDIIKSGRSGQYLAGFGREPELKKVTVSTGTGTTRYPVVHKGGSSKKILGGCDYVIRGPKGRERAVRDDYRRPKVRPEGRPPQAKILGKTVFLTPFPSILDIKQ